jgi:methionyl-tRNA synthetase
MRESDRILVTAALPYANGPIHLGHLAGAYLPADIYVRYQRLRGREVAFICGSDEHGVPITITAEEEGTTPQQVVDRYHEQNRKAFENLGISFDIYSRTSTPLHHKTALEFLLNFHSRGILKARKEKQFYDQKVEMFLPDRYVEGTCPVCSNPEARGDQCERCGSYLEPTDLINPKSKISGEKPVLRETSHLYFPLDEYQKRLESYMAERNASDGWKENVLKYCGSWFKEGLQPRAVTRDLDWGVKIPLPGFERKVIYVWFDAVLGYISATRAWSEQIGKPDDWRRYWQDERTKYVAFIGKDNVVFHCIVFPAMLMAWNDAHDERYILPENVPANEFLNFEGQKFSKSRGWGIDVQDFLQRFPPDQLRYYMATALPEYRDSDFTWKDFQAKCNNELADIFGNFVNRTLAFAERTFGGIVPKVGPLNERDRSILEEVRKTPLVASECYEEYRFREGLLAVMNLARSANKYFNDSEPWITAKSEPERCATTIAISIHLVRALAVLMEPVTPFSSVRILSMLRLTGRTAKTSWEAAGEMLIPEGHKIGKPEILFTKIEDTMIEDQLKQLGVTPLPPATPSAPKAEVKATIGIEDFRKVDLRIAKITECERLPKSEKLLKLQVEVGTEKRQILAGVAQHYSPQDLIGKSVVIVHNLQPAKLMGQESQGMLLAASDENGKLIIISPLSEITSGSVVK